jgi:hypothetical protein
MRFLIMITLVVCVFGNAVANAQVQLSVRHLEQRKTVIMKYLPADRVSTDWSLWSTREIRPNETVTFPLNQPGPYRVACVLKNGRSSPAQVSNKAVDLRAYAMRGRVYQLDLTFHQDGRNRDVQVMSVTLIDPETGNEDQLSMASGDAESEFVDGVLGNDWRTSFQAVRGPSVSGALDLDRDADEGGPVFMADQGYNRRLSELVAFEDPTGCHVIGRWTRDDGNLAGTFHFLVSKDNPTVLSGSYKVDGQDREYWWKSQ